MSARATERCSTCPFSPGNPLQLPAGGLRRMVTWARTHGLPITCNQTGVDTPVLVCHDYHDGPPTGTV